MADAELELELERPGAAFLPGERIRGVARARFGSDVPSNRTLLLRLAWRTSGRGDVESGTPLEVMTGRGDEVLYRVPVLLRPPRIAAAKGS
ncbi:MAG: hypothetical protein RL653_2384 [Pseudomonadota bacterium]|jgi:hypothetical protein